MQSRRLLLTPVVQLFVFLLVCQISYAQTRPVTGTITDEKGAPFIGRNSYCKNAKNSATTNASGKFEVLVPTGVNILVVSYVGYETKEVPIPANNVVNIVLRAAESSLESIVVVGYGTQKRRQDVTGAVGSVKGEAIRNSARYQCYRGIAGQGSRGGGH